MRAIVQRVKESSVSVDGKTIGEIKKGFTVLVGISKDDTIEDVKYLKKKVVNLRVFEDENGKLNKSLKDVDGELLIISQFTLYGDCRKGNRPSFIEALGGEDAKKLYLDFIDMCKEEINNVQTGEFGADMLVSIKNDGPVTLMIDSKKEF
ncbi:MULTISPECIES: D-aminoacyl-tRNA deacylase [Clostridium]|uniref:D-aminoacyl-tRNA deacylase n=1 Tax=Clostridium novyi (strain NT) TaxID=386415 RepID=DTD_CLONN|nr:MULTISPECIES: D-aminoacyl-tRNA deacylase [Clostridium]A0PZW6.1 RecName: Full=D-aminoacyl-tRNA deacylase; Short=DTD; AltName: Full=Gly-tRNA(Ala) deacylase [Clostridium novyi NT]ABK60983.1 D-tyrosyl-tRNA(Tyr) deacylase [Clostridium novyi NT]KEH88381.1 tyrosyl-tRNA deacylase [Clostridium novyi A str. NCTC 538]KEH88725.1 tyrosyl-tRNA deacylase [Clostridium novyi A str. 4540]KEH89043.1 tyrosyl-tRNA deacylase [Clostridium novyi A str. BKT29909]KEH94348.1 tyrosyl-tRNA deacylase [Clostridium botul